MSEMYITLEGHMPRNFNRRPISYTGFNAANHVFCGIVWPVVGSKGNRYSVELTEKGFTCTCTGFTMHGKCKHIQGVYDRIMDEHYPVYRWDY